MPLATISLSLSLPIIMILVLEIKLALPVSLLLTPVRDRTNATTSGDAPGAEKGAAAEEMGPGAVATTRRLTDIQFDLTVDLNKGLGPDPRADSEAPDPSRGGADGDAGYGIVEGSSPSGNDAGLGACIDALPEVLWHGGSPYAANELMVLPNDVESALLASADFTTLMPSMVAESMLLGSHAEDLASSLASSLFSAFSLPLGPS